jgi:hypothetical protein
MVRAGGHVGKGAGERCMNRGGRVRSAGKSQGQISRRTWDALVPHRCCSRAVRGAHRMARVRAISLGCGRGGFHVGVGPLHSSLGLPCCGCAGQTAAVDSRPPGRQEWPPGGGVGTHRDGDITIHLQSSRRRRRTSHAVDGIAMGTSRSTSNLHDAEGGRVTP